MGFRAHPKIMSANLIPVSMRHATSNVGTEDRDIHHFRFIGAVREEDMPDAFRHFFAFYDAALIDCAAAASGSERSPIGGG